MSTTVLVIADDAAARATLRLVLEGAGYAVIAAASGEAALGVLRTSPSGLVVVFDDPLPRLDGDGQLELVEREGWLTACHAFVYLTATPQDLPATWAYAVAHYGVPLVATPVVADDLLAAIRQAEKRLSLLPILPASERRSAWPAQQGS